MKNTAHRRYRVITPKNMTTPPDDFEKAIARLLAKYFSSDITFVDTASTSMPDILVIRLNQIWEIKRVDGNKRDTVHHSLGRAKKQSANVILVMGKTKFQLSQVVGYAKQELKIRRDIKRLILLSKPPIKEVVIKG